MTQLIKQTPFWLLITIGIAFIGLLGYVFGVKREKDIPDESEVIGKDLPIGFRFMKDGKVVEVVEDEFICTGCIYLKESNFNGCKHPDSVCSNKRRATNDSIVFKYIDHE